MQMSHDTGFTAPTDADVRAAGFELVLNEEVDEHVPRVNGLEKERADVVAADAQYAALLDAGLKTLPRNATDEQKQEFVGKTKVLRDAGVNCSTVFATLHGRVDEIWVAHSPDDQKTLKARAFDLLWRKLMEFDLPDDVVDAMHQAIGDVRHQDEMKTRSSKRARTA